ncbi:hypothetical protein GT037_004433 [Alternaria burnsii]|uniref:Uncharacterized protein n=1 Tax=Alternaria burnsii TaxID=1187904 RepID=A0A8H7EJ21_9PLEO|nr:uncharacterized protein GT037_004433 [Alternaria burnsii]KAF7677574.1 hypothetical protein GT037_004433 [Alternaria burnsii]CAI9627426.1 unnamed protein product [Alternaria burnsii]
MYPQLPAGPSGVPPRPPVTYSRHSNSARTPHQLGATIQDVDNEARGEAAFDRISRGTRGTHSDGAKFRAAARATIKAVKRPHANGSQSRQGMLKKPSVRPGKGKEKSDAPDSSGTHSSINNEEDDIVEAKVMSLFSNEKTINHAAQGHSYKYIGNGSTSSSTAPHTALYSLLDIMPDSAKAVEEVDPEKLATAGPELAHIIRGWHSILTRVIFATEAAEHKRIQDVQNQLDYDRVVEDKHKKEMDTFRRQVRAKMLQMQQDHQQELKEQKRAYENLLVKQVAKLSTPTEQDRKPTTEPAQPRTVKSPSPHLQDKVDCLTNEIATLKSENETKVSKMQASHADQVLILHQKIERLADANAFLRVQENPKHKMQEMERMKQTNEELLQQIKDIAGENARLRQRVPPVPAFRFTAGGRGFPESVQSDPGPSSQEGSENWSRKRARRQ